MDHSNAVFLVDGTEHKFFFPLETPISDVIEEVSERVGFDIRPYEFKQDDEGRYVIDRKPKGTPLSWGLSGTLKRVLG